MRIEGELIQDPFNSESFVFAVRNTLIPELSLKRGKVKDVYDLGSRLLIYFTDRVSAFDRVLPNLIPYKGYSLAAMSSYLFKKSSSVFPNHLIEMVDVNAILVKKASRVDVEWIARKYLYGSMWREYKEGRRDFWGYRLPSGLKLAEELPDIIITPTTKSETGHDQPISMNEAVRRKMISVDDWKYLEEATIRLYEFYSKEMLKKGLILADMKVEFGMINDCYVQIDEPPTHDSARIWVEELYEEGKPQVDTCLDKEFLRECLRTLGFRGEGSPPNLPEEVVREVSKRALGAYLVASGRKSVRDIDLKRLSELMSNVR